MREMDVWFGRTYGGDGRGNLQQSMVHYVSVKSFGETCKAAQAELGIPDLLETDIAFWEIKGEQQITILPADNLRRSGGPGSPAMSRSARSVVQIIRYWPSMGDRIHDILYRLR